MAGVLSAPSASDTVDWHSTQRPWTSPPLHWLSALRWRCPIRAAGALNGRATIDFFYGDSVERREEGN